MVAPNIFKPRNDWNILAFRCRKYTPINTFEFKLSSLIKVQTGADPMKEKNLRRGSLVQARQLFAVMMTKHTKRTYYDIGQMIGKDHATINHSIKTVNNMYDTDKHFKQLFDDLNIKAEKLSHNGKQLTPII